MRVIFQATEVVWLNLPITLPLQPPRLRTALLSGAEHRSLWTAPLRRPFCFATCKTFPFRGLFSVQPRRVLQAEFPRTATLLFSLLLLQLLVHSHCVRFGGGEGGGWKYGGCQHGQQWWDRSIIRGRKKRGGLKYAEVRLAEHPSLRTLVSVCQPQQLRFFLCVVLFVSGVKGRE